MKSGYCGRDCAACDQREGIQCPGCMDGPGRYHSADCALAKCARSRGSCCQDCGQVGECSNYRGRSRIHMQVVHSQQQAKASRQEEKQVEQYLEPRLRLLEKWLTPLFWVDLAYVVSRITGATFLDDVFPLLRWILYLVLYAAIIGKGILYLKLVPLAPKYYYMAGLGGILFGIVAAVIEFCGFRSAAVGVKLAAAAVWITVELVHMAGVTLGNGKVIGWIDENLEKDWKRLLLWAQVCAAVEILIIVIMLVPQELGLAAYLESLYKLPMYGIHILRVAYLYKTRKACWEYRVLE